MGRLLQTADYKHFFFWACPILTFVESRARRGNASEREAEGEALGETRRYAKRRSLSPSTPPGCGYRLSVRVVWHTNVSFLLRISFLFFSVFLLLSFSFCLVHPLRGILPKRPRLLDQKEDTESRTPKYDLTQQWAPVLRSRHRVSDRKQVKFGQKASQELGKFH